MFFFLFFFFFFFQAEDGIRDLTVTGVQTCALPILTRTRYRIFGKRPAMSCATSWTRWESKPKSARSTTASRSEERRVGKECRSRWSPYHEKKKKQKKQTEERTNIRDKSRQIQSYRR